MVKIKKKKIDEKERIENISERIKTLLIFCGSLIKEIKYLKKAVEKLEKRVKELEVKES